MSKLNNRRKPISLRRTFKSTYTLIISLMLIPSIFSFIATFISIKTYDNIITNVSRANNINQMAKNELPNELWDIVCGKQKFEEGMQYEVLEEIKNGLESILEKTNSTHNRQRLEVALRTRQTLLRNINMLGNQINSGSSVSKNQASLEEIRTITNLFSDVMQDYIVSEIESAEILNTSIKHSTILIFIILIIIICFVSLFSFRSLINTSINFDETILNIESVSSKIASGDLDSRIPPPPIEEFTHLTDNLNLMAKQIELLIEKNINEQKNLQKAEIKALQAQITPHFLYNTFDSIIWLAEEDKTEEVVKITKAFSEFLRISLSRGHEWITVQQELEHIKNYLTIQKIRYADILNYEIQADPRLNDFKILKLLLQPLVENAIYHGIKNKRGRGNLKVIAEFADEEQKYMKFSVIDDGAGFTEERLKQVESELEQGSDDMEQLSSVYGIFNVNKKLNLYYNSETSGLKIKSTPGNGSNISFVVPCIKESDVKNV